MQKILFMLLVLAISVGAQSKKYYWVKVQGRIIGYIVADFVQNVDYRGTTASIRKVRSFFKTNIRQKSFNYHLLEETIYGTKIFSYSLEYERQKHWGKYLYQFNDSTMQMTVFRQQKDNVKNTLPIPTNCNIISDYFSLLPLLRKCQDYPVIFDILDPKRIHAKLSAVPLQKMLIKPLGERFLKLANKRILARCYALSWGQTALRVYTLKTYELLRLENFRAKTVISISNKAIAPNFTGKHVDFLQKKRPFPFVSGKKYSYLFTYDKRKVGKLTFDVRNNKKLQQYHLTAQCDIKQQQKQYSSRSKTVYTHKLKPLSYRLTNKSLKVEIACDFVLRGVNERFIRDENILERYVPLPRAYIFLDNNAMHLFAVFMSQCPFKRGKVFSLPIFHPRRLQCTEGVFRVLDQKNKLVHVELKTQYHTMHMWLDATGKMVKYRQGKLEVVLQP